MDHRPAPVTPTPSAPAAGLLDLLHRLSGRRILAGQHNQPVHGSAWTRQLTELTGAVPALWGQDFGFSAPGTLDGVDRRAANLAEAVDWHRRGAVITYTWHAVCPLDDEPVGFTTGIQQRIPAGAYDEILTPGTRLHGRWQAQVDVVAGLLGELDAAGVPVLWRPYHEMNGSWFWWGGDPPRLVALWRQLFDRFVHQHGLANLIWVWSPNAAYGSAAPFAPFFPGHDVVDALAVDTYGGHFEDEHYQALLALAGGRPIGFGEVGELPGAEVLAAQPRWCWFMGWPDNVLQGNEPDAIRALYAAPTVLTLEELGTWSG